MSQTAVATPVSVVAALNYLHDNGQRPVSYTYDPPPGVPQYSGENEPHDVVVRNARALAGPGDLTLDQSGFELVAAPTAVKDFSDADVIRNLYYPEAEDTLKRVTGAVKVVIFDHTLRDSERGQRGQPLREPVRRVHNDQTFVSGPRRVRDHLPAEEAEIRLRQRFAIINLWRPIGSPVEQLPLALCDARTIAPDDLIPSDLVYPDKVGETYSFRYNPRHSWYYYPRLTPDEALLLKIYDSRTDGTARLTAHTAFDDPNSPADAAPRRSIELRALVFFAPGA
jgi:hypothetical protein